MWATLRQARRDRGRASSRCSTRASIRASTSRPRRARQREAEIAAEIEAALQKVESLDEDRILRRFVNAVQAAIRTNFYQLDDDGQPKPLIAIKFASRKLDGAAAAAAALRDLRLFAAGRGRASALRQGGARRHPLVRPAAGFPHRGARPGEGAAGQERGDRAGRRQGRLRAEAAAGRRHRARRSQAEGIAAYKLFISTLLDITDNLDADERACRPTTSCATTATIPISWSPPTRAPRPSPTSPTRISQEHGFWLGDAFASGGSAGYDHKKMGITARGAWEAVKRHFREMDVDIGTTPFTVVGVGDMSGDVFGNGMLRETTIKLVAAFDHRDIFIDPDPDPAKSFAERQRLFDLPRSSWQDYDKALISKGGGVFSRSLKEIALSPEAQAVLGLAQGQGDAAGGDERDPEGAGRSAVLRRHRHLCARRRPRPTRRPATAPTTRSASPARELRCKVIGEGANLGMTQRGRIEAALHGVRLNTDAIDNSAGVNTSDVEVNIKIALSRPMRDGRLTLRRRATRCWPR